MSELNVANRTLAIMDNLRFLKWFPGTESRESGFRLCVKVAAQRSKRNLSSTRYRPMRWPGCPRRYAPKPDGKRPRAARR